MLGSRLAQVEGNDLEHEIVVSAAGGDVHSAVATSSGVVYTWGFGQTGALGHGDLENLNGPRRVESLLAGFEEVVEVTQVACGAYHTLARSKKGEVWCWGDGEFGALGLEDQGDAETHRAVSPRLLDFAAAGGGKGPVAHIAAGHLTSCAVDDQGGLLVWGCAMGEDGATATPAELRPKVSYWRGDVLCCPTSRST